MMFRSKPQPTHTLNPAKVLLSCNDAQRQCHVCEPWRTRFNSPYRGIRDMITALLVVCSIMLTGAGPLVWTS